MFSTLDDREIEGLLSGQPTANAELAPLVELVATLRRSVGEVVPTMSASLRGQLRTTPVVPITARQAGRSALYKAGAVAAAVLAVVGLGVGASQNRLPSSLQDVLSSTADIIGIHVPATSERGSSRAHADESGTGGTSSKGNDDGEPGGGNDNTTGGAVPADPGTPGDHAPATPATPPEQSSGTPGEHDAGPPDEHSDPDTVAEPAQPPVTTPEPASTVPPPPEPEPEPPAAPEVEPEEATGPGNNIASTNASTTGTERSARATGAGETGNGPAGEQSSAAVGTDQGRGGPPEAKFTAAEHGPPADVLPAA